MDTYKEEQRKELQKYEEFVRDPSQVWQRFLAGYRKKRQENLALHPNFCEPDDGGPCCGFDDLDPGSRFNNVTGLLGDMA